MLKSLQRCTCYYNPSNLPVTSAFLALVASIAKITSSRSQFEWLSNLRQSVIKQLQELPNDTLPIGATLFVSNAAEFILPLSKFESYCVSSVQNELFLRYILEGLTLEDRVLDYHYEKIVRRLLLSRNTSQILLIAAIQTTVKYPQLLPQGLTFEYILDNIATAPTLPLKQGWIKLSGAWVSISDHTPSHHWLQILCDESNDHKDFGSRITVCEAVVSCLPKADQFAPGLHLVFYLLLNLLLTDDDKDIRDFAAKGASNHYAYTTHDDNFHCDAIVELVCKLIRTLVSQTPELVPCLLNAVRIGRPCSESSFNSLLLDVLAQDDALFAHEKQNLWRDEDGLADLYIDIIDCVWPFVSSFKAGIFIMLQKDLQCLSKTLNDAKCILDWRINPTLWHIGMSNFKLAELCLPSMCDKQSVNESLNHILSLPSLNEDWADRIRGLLERNG